MVFISDHAHSTRMKLYLFLKHKRAPKSTSPIASHKNGWPFPARAVFPAKHPKFRENDVLSIQQRGGILVPKPCNHLQLLLITTIITEILFDSLCLFAIKKYANLIRLIVFVNSQNNQGISPFKTKSTFHPQLSK